MTHKDTHGNDPSGAAHLGFLKINVEQINAPAQKFSMAPTLQPSGQIVRFLVFGGLVTMATALQASLRVPSLVLHGESVQLDCRYQLAAGELLYSIKWYKNLDEFYRYIFADVNPVTVYPLPGINVDEQHSNSSRVTLNSVNFNTTATYRCEVSGDAPEFRTAIKSAVLTVILLEDGPFITGMRDRYELDEVLDANCTPPTVHPAGFAAMNKLIWNFNHQQISPRPEGPWNGNGPVAVPIQNSAAINLKVTLSRQHFDAKGELHLSCTIIIGNHAMDRSIARVAKLLQLGSNKEQQQQWPTLKLKGRERFASYATGGGSSRWPLPVALLLARILPFLLIQH